MSLLLLHTRKERKVWAKQVTERVMATGRVVWDGLVAGWQQCTAENKRVGQDRKEANTSSEPKKFGKLLSAFALSQARESSENWTDRGGRNQERFGSLFVLTAEKRFCKANNGQSIWGGGGAGKLTRRRKAARQRRADNARRHRGGRRRCWCLAAVRGRGGLLFRFRPTERSRFG